MAMFVYNINQYSVIDIKFIYLFDTKDCSYYSL